jgi:2-polyprenyl-6-methoxyphenol hydroxylase-like FAD-dependent oxidoreductase
MHIAVIGAGAAGLLFALLIKRRFPAWRVEAFEQNPQGATYGFGVVFSDGALAFLERDEPELLRVIEAGMERWPMQRIVHRGERVEVDGNGFSAIGRLALQEVLQGLCRRVGVEIRYGRAISSLDELAGADLVVGADGSNSLVRDALAAQFAPKVEVLSNRFAWYGTLQPFECLTLTFRDSKHGAFVAHHYRHSPSMSTFVVECGDATWKKAGLDRMSDAESRSYCERVFASDLGGHGLESNKSVWRQFPLVRNERWVARLREAHVVLLGDALRTVHFSIGSGTRLAFEDAIALERAFAERGEDVSRALAAFERERRPVVEKLLAAANASSYWYERFPEKMDFEPWRLAYDYMTRSGRMTEERLRSVAPKFMARVDAERSGNRGAA